MADVLLEVLTAPPPSLGVVSSLQDATVQARAKVGLLAEAIYNNDYKTRAQLTHLSTRGGGAGGRACSRGARGQPDLLRIVFGHARRTSADEADGRRKGLPRFYAVLDEQEALLEKTIQRMAALQQGKGQGAADTAAASPPAAPDAAAATSETAASAEAAEPGIVVPKIDVPTSPEGVTSPSSAVSATPSARRNTLYRVDIKDGLLELPQVPGRLMRAQLESENCYLLDCIVHLYMWVGRKSKPEQRVAARKMAAVRERHLAGERHRRTTALTPSVRLFGALSPQVLYRLVPRPPWAKFSRVLDRTETEQFKRHFDDWVTVVRADFAQHLPKLAGRRCASAVAAAACTGLRRAAAIGRRRCGRRPSRATRGGRGPGADPDGGRRARNLQGTGRADSRLGGAQIHRPDQRQARRHERTTGAPPSLTRSPWYSEPQLTGPAFDGGRPAAVLRLRRQALHESAGGGEGRVLHVRRPGCWRGA